MHDDPERPDRADPAGPSPEEAWYVTPPAPAPEPAKRNGTRLALGLAAVVAVLAAAFGVASVAQGDGASSAEGAVEDLFAAIDDEDVIGVVQAITPAERSVLRPAVEDVAGEAERLEVASDDLDLTHIAGIELEVDGLELTSSELGDGVAAVHVTGGTLDSSVAIDDLPLGPVVREVLDRQDDEIDDTSDRADLQGIELVAIERDGGWRVSLLYSIAEAARRGADPEPAVPDFGAGIAERGADSPEGAVRELVAAATELDVQRLIELTAGDELEVLHDYGPLLVDAAADAEVDATDVVSVDDLELEVHDGDDGRKVVEATAYALSFGDEESGVDITFDGECTTVVTRWSYAFETVGEPIGPIEDGGFEPDDDDLGDIDIEPDVGMPVPGYRGSDPEEETFESCVGEEQSLSPMGLFGSFGTGLAAPRIVVEEHDGLWYVAPVRTVFDTLLEGVRAIGSDDVRNLTRMWTGEAEWLWYGEEFWEECGVPQPGPDASEREGEAAMQECFEASWDNGGWAEDGPP